MNDAFTTLLEDITCWKDGGKSYTWKHLRLIAELHELIEGFTVAESLTKDIRVFHGRTKHDKAYTVCIRQNQNKSSQLQASFKVCQFTDIIECTLNEDVLKITFENEPELAQFGFKVPDVSYNEKKQSGERLIDCMINNIEDAKTMLKLLSRWVRE